MMRRAVIYDFFHGTDKMLNIRKRVFITCLSCIAVMPVPAQPEVSFPRVIQDLRGNAHAQRSATPSPDVGSKTLAVEEKQVTYSVDSSGLVRFSFDAKGYRNTYMLDCEKRLFLWIENVRLSTGEVTDNNAGAEWKPLTPNSTISNAVHEVGCRPVLAGIGEGDGNKAGTNAQEPSFDCSQAKSWSEKTVCNNPTAAALDLQVSRLYNTARAQATDTRKVELKNAQMEWLRKRENCEQYSDKTECLLNVYHDRVAELGSLIPAAEDMEKAAPDGYTVPKLAKITLETDTLEIEDLDSFLGIWEYPDTDSKEPTNYLKVIRISAHKFRLIEGYKNWYVNDKDKIRWFDRSQDTFEPEPPIIYLQPSEGKLVGQFVSGNFRPTHGVDFTYRVTLEKESPNTLRYSVWLSGNGKDGRTETFEATKVAGDVEISVPNTAENGAVVPVTVSIHHENIRDIVIYSGDLSRMAIKVVLAPLASPWLSTRIRMPQTGPVIVVATTIDGRELTAEKEVVVIGGKGFPSDEVGGVLDDNTIKMRGRNDEVKMLVTSAMSTRSHVSSLRVSAGDALLADAVVTPWVSENPYFAFKSVRDVGGQFKVELGLNTGERVTTSKDGTSEITQVASTVQPPGPAKHSERKSSSSSTGIEVPADKIQVKDGSTVSGKIAGGKVPFKSSLGTVEVNVKDVKSFSGGKLHLADGTVLTGTFTGGAIEVVASVGTLQVPADNVLSIVRAGQSEEELDRSTAQHILLEHASVQSLRKNIPLHISGLDKAINQEFLVRDRDGSNPSLTSLSQPVLESASSLSLGVKVPLTVEIDVTGITSALPALQATADQSSIRLVEFNWQYKNVNSLLRRFCISGGSGKALFQRYDDGWRLKDVSLDIDKTPPAMSKSELNDEQAHIDEIRKKREETRKRLLGEMMDLLKRTPPPYGMVRQRQLHTERPFKLLIDDSNRDTGEVRGRLEFYHPKDGSVFALNGTVTPTQLIFRTTNVLNQGKSNNLADQYSYNLDDEGNFKGENEKAGYASDYSIIYLGMDKRTELARADDEYEILRESRKALEPSRNFHCVDEFSGESEGCAIKITDVDLLSSYEVGKRSTLVWYGDIKGYKKAKCESPSNTFHNPLSTPRKPCLTLKPMNLNLVFASERERDAFYTELDVSVSAWRKKYPSLPRAVE